MRVGFRRRLNTKSFKLLNKDDKLHQKEEKSRKRGAINLILGVGWKIFLSFNFNFEELKPKLFELINAKQLFKSKCKVTTENSVLYYEFIYISNKYLENCLSQ